MPEFFHILFFVAFIIAVGLIAAKKGRSPVGWVLICLFFNVIGLLLLAASSNLKKIKCSHCGNEFVPEGEDDTGGNW